jgi:hypothetical protein
MPKKQGISRFRKKITTTATNLPPVQNTAINQDSINSNDNISASVESVNEVEGEQPTLSTYLTIKDIHVPVLDEKARRLAIAYLFQLHGAPEDTLVSPWSVVGSNYCITAIVRKTLNLEPWYNVSNIFNDYLKLTKWRNLYWFQVCI